MDKLQLALARPKMQLFVSLPSNDLEMAAAAIRAGADGMKVHMNVGHRASGNSFADLMTYRQVFEELRATFDGPLGIVPAGSYAQVDRTEIEQLEQIGFDFYSIFAQHMPSYLLHTQKLTPTFGIDDQYDYRWLEVVTHFPVAALEAAIVPGDEYGTPLTFADLLKYRYLVERSGLPVIVPSQRSIQAEDVQALIDCGVRVLLIGAVVTGKEAEGLERKVASFRDAIDRATN